MAERSRMAIGVLVVDAEPGVPNDCSEIKARDGLIAPGSKWCAERRSVGLAAAPTECRKTRPSSVRKAPV
jgi:hypothetical protein